MNKSFGLKRLYWFWLIILVLITDLSSKFIILRNFSVGDVFFVSKFLNLCYVKNYGIAFGFFSDSPKWEHWFFSGISITICILLILQIYQLNSTEKLNSIAYAIIVGGALGNLLDHFWYGFVIDMIDFHIGNLHFATFNLADSAICIGSAIIIAKDLFKR